MTRTFRISWLIVLCLSTGNYLPAQTDSTKKKISDSGYVQAIDRITAHDIRGNYCEQTTHGYIKLHIHGNHYRRRGYTYFGWCLDKGKWEIKNDTLYLTPSWSREHPFAGRERDTTPYVLKLIMIDGSLYFFGYENGHVVTRGRWVTVHEWRKTRRSRRNLRRRT